MCSWCYAFNSSLTQLHKNLPTSVRIQYLLGGLAADTTEPMPIGLQETIQKIWRQIENTIPNIQFNYDFWKLNIPFRSTFPACRAILAARKQDSRFETKIIHAIQKAYYQHAKNPSLQTTLQECAIEAEVNSIKFIKDLGSIGIEDELQSEIKLTRSLGIRSCPSLCLLYNEQQFLITIDYLNHQTMIDKINNILENFST
jgi:putative protein-disulfide isomerase